MPHGSFYKGQAKGFVIGLSGGVFGGLVGLGGGVIMIPLMVVLGKLTQHAAHGTSLVAIVFTGLIGAATYFFNGYVDWKASLVLAICAVATARIGALYAHSLPEKTLKRAFGFFLVFVAVLLVSKGTIMRASFHAGPVLYYVILSLTGIFTGFVSGMMGIGGGGIMIPALVILIGMPQHLAQGTSLLAMVPGSAMGAATHYKLGNISRKIAAGLAVGAAIGGYFGATFAHFVPEFYLKLIFAVISIWMGIRFIRT